MNFEETYNRLFKRVLAYIASRVNAQTTAQELAADTWQQVWLHQSSFSWSLIDGKFCVVFSLLSYRKFTSFKKKVLSDEGIIPQ